MAVLYYGKTFIGWCSVISIQLVCDQLIATIGIVKNEKSFVSATVQLLNPCCGLAQSSHSSIEPVPRNSFMWGHICNHKTCSIRAELCV